MRVLNYSGSGIETTFTQGEDACLNAWAPTLPAAAADAKSSLMVVGSLADVVEDQFVAPVHRDSASRTVQFLPPRHSDATCRPMGPNTRSICWRSRSSPTPPARSKSGARTRLAAPFPLGVEGTTQLAAAPLRAAWGVDDSHCSSK